MKPVAHGRLPHSELDRDLGIGPAPLIQLNRSRYVVRAKPRARSDDTASLEMLADGAPMNTETVSKSRDRLPCCVSSYQRIYIGGVQLAGSATTFGVTVTTVSDRLPSISHPDEALYLMRRP